MAEVKPDTREDESSLGTIVFVRIPELLMALLLFVAIGINFANIIGRYLLGAAIFWAEEAMIYMVIWSVFLSAIAIAWRGEHLCMDLFSARATAIWRLTLGILTVVLLLACSTFVVFQSYKVMSLHFQTGMVSVAAGIPMVLPHAALLVGFVLTALAVLLRLGFYLRGRPGPG